MDHAQPNFDVEPTVSNHFAWMRTQMALQNTLLAGVRTSVSLVGFGFTVAQFFQRMQTKVDIGVQVAPNAARNLGLTLIAAGVGLLAVFLWQYRAMSNYMWQGLYLPLAGPHTQRQRTAPFVVGCVVLLIGLAAFIAVFLRF
jgi:putative membrane protein